MVSYLSDPQLRYYTFKFCGNGSSTNNIFFLGWEPSSFCAGWRLAFVPDSLLGLAFVPDPTADGDGCGGWEPPSFYAGWRRAFVPDSLRGLAFVPEPTAEGEVKLGRQNEFF